MRCSKKLFFELRNVTNRTQNRIFSAVCQNEESMQLFCQFKFKTRAFYTFYEGINAKCFRLSIAFAIVVTSRSSSFKYTMSVYAVHAGAERNVCNIVVSTEVPKTTTNPSQTLLLVCKLAHLLLPHSKSSPRRPHNL